MPAEDILDAIHEDEEFVIAKDKEKKLFPDEIDKEVHEVQLAVADGVSRQDKEGSSHEIVVRDESVIQLVRQHTIEEIIPAMDEYMAGKLKFFADNVDLDHPTIQPLLEKGFQKDSEFNSTLREIMSLLTIAKNGDMQRVLGLMKESFKKSKSLKEIRVAVYKPPIRALRTKEVRDEARQKKVTKEVVLKEWLEKAKNWNDHPASLLAFTRLNDAHQEDVAKNEKKAVQMQQLGMTSLAGSFRKRNEIIANFLGEQYCGFTKLKMLDAAIILAKVHGADFRVDYKTISYPRKVFDKGGFWLEPDNTYIAKDFGKDANPEAQKKVSVQACMIPDIFALKPRAYPLHEFNLEQSDHVRETLAAVEDHPDMLGKAIFDQFWVVVPGIALATEMHNYPMANGQSRWVIRHEKGCELYDTAEQAEKVLDLRLTQAGCLHPVLVGERDGKCYMISYWR